MRILIRQEDFTSQVYELRLEDEGLSFYGTKSHFTCKTKMIGGDFIWGKK